MTDSPKTSSSKPKNTRMTPTKTEWSEAWVVTRRDFKGNLIGFIGTTVFFIVLFTAGFAWQHYFGGSGTGSCYQGAPGASNLPVNQVEC